MLGYMQDLPATNEREPLGRISVLEDTNDDGKMDKKTVFVDGLILPRALKVLDHGVLVGEPPNLWLAKDTNGDLKADTKELVVDTYGDRTRQRRAQRQQPVVGARQLDVHVRAQRLPAAEERQVRGRSRRCRAASGARRRTTPGASTATRTSRRCSSICVPARYFMRNPNLLRTRGSYESLEEPRTSQHRLAGAADAAASTAAIRTAFCGPTAA